MEELEWILAFVNEISAPAKEMTRDVRELTGSLKELQQTMDKMKPINLSKTMSGGGSGGLAKQTSDLQKFADMWQRIGLKMQRDQAAAQQKAANEYAKFWEKALAGQEKAIPKGFASMWQKIGMRMQKDAATAAKAAEPGITKSFADMWQRIGLKMMADQTKAQKAAAAAAAREADRASHKSYFGGHRSVRELLRARASSKMSGLATGAADALLNAPGAMVGGAFGALGAVAEGTAKIAYNFAKAAISAQSMREDSVSGFTAIFGSATEANRLFDVARTAAKQTKFDTADVVRDFNTLAAGGFAANQIERVYWSSADIGSARGAGNQQRYINALSKINANPQAAFGTVQQAAMAGPGLKNVYASLGKQLGIDPSTMTRKKWMELFKDGKITGDMALESVIGASNALYNKRTGKPGEYARSQGDTSWAGTLSNIKNGLGDVLNMQLSENHPMNQFKKILQAIGSSGGLFDSTSKRGKELESIISDLMSDVFRLVGLDTSEIDNGMDGILKIARAAQEMFSHLVDYIRKEVYPAVGKALAELNSSGVEEVLGRFAARIAWIISKGIANGIINAFYATENIGLTPQQIESKNRFLAKESGKPTTVELGTDAPGGMPSFPTGGVVPGPRGKPRLVIAHGEEVFLGMGGTFDPKRGTGGAQNSVLPPITMQVIFQGPINGGDESSITAAVKQGGLEMAMELLEQISASQGANS